MTRFTYKITDGVLEIWDNDNPNENNAPFLRQPEWPDGTPWNNDQEIADWAESVIADLLNPEPLTPPSPDKPQN